jgi:hypothetical protein
MRAERARLIVQELRETTDASPAALEALERALTRGNVSDPRAYLEKIRRFQESGEWVTERVSRQEPAPRPSEQPWRVTRGGQGGKRALPGWRPD